METRKVYKVNGEYRFSLLIESMHTRAIHESSHSEVILEIGNPKK